MPGISRFASSVRKYCTGPAQEFVSTRTYVKDLLDSSLGNKAGWKAVLGIVVVIDISAVGVNQLILV